MNPKTIPPVTKLFNRVMVSMNVGRQGIRLEEWDVVHAFWPSLTTLLNNHKSDAMLLPLFEEALVLRVLTHRLLRELETGNKPEEYKVDFKEGVKAWLKTQERLRNIMNEILKRYGQTTSENTFSLAAIMAPILEQGEGILDDALQFETRKKSTQKNIDETRVHPGVDATA